MNFRHKEWFPFVTGDVDVSAYDYWVTLGGTEKGNSPTNTELSDSATNAVRLYWLLKSLGSEANSTTYEATSTNNLLLGQDKPYNRAISGAFIQYTEDESVQIVLSSTLSTGIVRMFDGITTDKTNFVGYGMAGDSGINSYFLDPSFDGIGFSWNGSGNPSGSPRLAIGLSSYYSTVTPGAGEYYDYAYVTTHGISFVCMAYADSASPTASAMEYSAYDEDGGNAITFDAISFYPIPVLDN